MYWAVSKDRGRRADSFRVKVVEIKLETLRIELGHY